MMKYWNTYYFITTLTFG